MSALLDVNMLLACGWQTHPEHGRALAWLDAESEFFTCPLVELGFIRVSIGPGYRAAFSDAIQVLSAIRTRTTARSCTIDLEVRNIPAVSSHSDVTDSYLVALAKMHGLRLATLDVALTTKSWAGGVAFHPFARPIDVQS